MVLPLKKLQQKVFQRFCVVANVLNNIKFTKFDPSPFIPAYKVSYIEWPILVKETYIFKRELVLEARIFHFAAPYTLSVKITLSLLQSDAH